MSLEKVQDRVGEKAKYEFMQEFSIIPKEREQNHKLDTESEKAHQKNKK